MEFLLKNLEHETEKLGDVNCGNEVQQTKFGQATVAGFPRQPNINDALDAYCQTDGNLDAGGDYTTDPWTSTWPM